jgi:pimeloyl-ACP methyl ester carboxylesterase
MTEHYRPRRPPHSEQLAVRGVRHRVIFWGERTDHPILLLHGWMDTGDTWQFLVDQLPPNWSFAAPDWRGFGGSEWPQGDYWFPDYYADLEALLDALLPHEPARVIGHSMGANIATIYAGVRPARLAWLVNLEGFGLPRTSADQAPDRYAEWLDQLKLPERAARYRSAEALTENLMARHPLLDRGKAAFIARAWTRPAESGVELAADPRHRRINPTLYRREEVEACWRRVRVPMLLMLGELSELRPRLGEDATDAYLRSLVPRAQIVTVARAGHMLHHETPESVAAHIAGFAATAREVSE